MAPRTIVFDLDGTLVDTAPDLIGSLNLLFAREGLAPIPLNEGRGMIGGGVKPLIERGLAAQGRVLTAAQLDALYGRPGSRWWRSISAIPRCR
jgi:phosphoglycolate phosphatase